MRCAALGNRLDRKAVKARCASARLAKSQEGSIKYCFRGEDGCPLEISRSFLAGVSEHSHFTRHKPLDRVVDQGFSGHTAGWTIRKIITFTLRDAESCDWGDIAQSHFSQLHVL
jgi:hypothetical protein